ncbi:ABC transporter substrate-binding protein [Salinivibrio sp. ES.052]|uniref:ABC transporter substrate-binding protein n=1 Tax=Salinivibrio sp. ES.052 TaxID=1882823 RepID=UPI0009409E51|nr:ABC transporter substrate-binding protein [Salinivibrio sp. ES.052]
MMINMIANADQSPTRVLFINPGYATESFWYDVDEYTNAAATALDIDLTIRHADRNHFVVRQILAATLSKPNHPDYIILVNEKLAAKKLLPILKRYPIYIQFILNDVDEQTKTALYQDPHWQQYLLPSIIPNNHAIGYAIAQAMVQASDNAPGEAIMISGDLTTPASVQREAGGKRFFIDHSDITLHQVVHGQWDESISYEQMGTLLQRYPDVRYVWTANDHMAFGAIKAAKEAGKTPGDDIFFATVNTSKKVLSLREQGDISALGGGHFTAAGLALSHIYAHDNGWDIPKRCKEQLFRLIKPNSLFFSQLRKQAWHEIPFLKMAQQTENYCAFTSTPMDN